MRLAYIGSASSSATTQTITFSGQSIGPAFNDRYIAVVVGTFEPGGTAVFASSVTLDGVAMEGQVSAAGGGSDDPTVEIWWTTAPKASGTTASIVVDFGSGNNNSRTIIAVYAIGGVAGLYNYGWNAFQDGGGGNIVANQSSREGGITIAAFVSKSTASPTITWSGSHGVVKDADINLSGSILSVASRSNNPVKNAAQVICTSSAPNNADSMIVQSHIAS